MDPLGWINTHDDWTLRQKQTHFYILFFTRQLSVYRLISHDKCHLHEMLFPNLKKTVASGILWIKIKRRILTFPTEWQKGINREFKIRRLRTKATGKYATAHDQNQSGLRRTFCSYFAVSVIQESRLFLKKVFNSPALSETEAKYVSCV